MTKEPPSTPTVRECDVHDQAVSIADNLRFDIYDIDQRLAELDGWHRSRWDKVPKVVRKKLVHERPDFEPIQTIETHNITCIGLHEHTAAKLDPSTTTVDPPTQIAFGDDAAGGFAESDTSLNNRVGDISLTDPGHDGASWTCSEYVSSLELNGYTLRELGVESEGGALWNHAELPTYIDKTNSIGVIVNVEIPIDDDSTP